MEYEYDKTWSQVSDLASSVAKKYIKDSSHHPDVIQEMHLALALTLPSYGGRASLRTWARGLFKNTALKYYRDYIAGDSDVDFIGDIHDTHYTTMVENPEVALQAKEIINVIYRTLGEDDGDIFISHFLDGYSLDDIVEYTGVARATLHYRLGRDWLLVEEALKKEGYDALPQM